MSRPRASFRIHPSAVVGKQEPGLPVGLGVREMGAHRARGCADCRLPCRATAGDCLESSYFKEKPLRESPRLSGSACRAAG